MGDNCMGGKDRVTPLSVPELCDCSGDDRPETEIPMSVAEVSAPTAGRSSDGGLISGLLSGLTSDLVAGLISVSVSVRICLDSEADGLRPPSSPCALISLIVW